MAKRGPARFGGVTKTTKGLAAYSLIARSRNLWSPRHARQRYFRRATYRHADGRRPRRRASAAARSAQRFPRARGARARRRADDRRWHALSDDHARAAAIFRSAGFGPRQRLEQIPLIGSLIDGKPVGGMPAPRSRSRRL